MKSSNDNTPLLVGLFVLAAIIIALIVYYTRPGETKTSEQTSDTTELKIENLTFERTLNPDPSVSSGTSGYTIEPYGVEYATGDTEYMTLSKNVTFTMNWTNAPGFNDVVKGFKIEHYVKATGATSYPTNANQTLLKKQDDENISITDFGACSAKIVSNGNYLVIGQNSFKLYAVVQKDNQNFNWANPDTQKFVELYDGTTETPEPTELNISKSQLSVTLSMTSAETVSYTPETLTGTTTSTIIYKKAYEITNNAGGTLNLGVKGVYLTLIPQTMGKYFNFTYEDGEYLRDDLTKGPVTTTNGKSKFKFEIVDKVDNTGKIREVSTETSESKKKYLSSDGSTLKLYTQIQSDLTQTIYNGFKWTFVDWEPPSPPSPPPPPPPPPPSPTSPPPPDPINCQGTYDENFGPCYDINGNVAVCAAGTQTKKFNITTQPNSTGTQCPSPSVQFCYNANCPGGGGGGGGH